MKRFFDDGDLRGAAAAAPAPLPHAADPGTITLTTGPTGARIAVYDGLAVAPRVEDIAAEGLADAIEQLASRTYNIARERGGAIPYTIIREVSENLIHAGFLEVVVTILDDGRTVRFADQGPGIPDKEKAFLPGFSTATAGMKQIIRGVGSGLPIVLETLTFAGGTVEIDDNLGSGTVVTLRSSSRPSPEEGAGSSPIPSLTDRQKQVLSLILELRSAGPSLVARELHVSVATAHRDLTVLEEAGLIEPDDTGRRTLTEYGVTCLEHVFQ
ncbi:MAG: ATP-binding protein [Coriobacteriia bacterium]|nr:ATP-binding protein [Coriobacteriia bacterium]